MSAGLQTLPPDQRAVLQLILKQGRGYADLSGLLRIDEAAVRARAHAGLDALVPDGAGAALTPERRAQVADWLLDQQDEEERAATLTHLGDSAAARRFANALREQLAPLARDELPQVPAAPARNGRVPVAAAPAEPSRPSAPRSFDEPRGRRPRAGAAPQQRSSKLGGILLLAGAVALVAVIVVVLVSRGGDDDSSGGGSAASPTAQTQTQQQRASARGGAATPLAQVNLNSTSGAPDSLGVAFVMRQDGQLLAAIQVRGVPANGTDDVYAAWLRAPGGATRFLGYVPRQLRRAGGFTVSAGLPADVARYGEVLIARQPITSQQTPSRPGTVVLSGPLRLRG